jgi:AAA+ superfamily predicted ATPase
MQPVLQIIARVGPSDANVLITGENGTGKGVIARALHAASPRAGKPLVVVLLSGYVGLASIAAAFALTIYVVASGSEPHAPLLAFACTIAAIVLWTHRSNIIRMIRGEEPRALHRHRNTGEIRPGAPGHV